MRGRQTEQSGEHLSAAQELPEGRRDSFLMQCGQLEQRRAEGRGGVLLGEISWEWCRAG